MSMFELKSIGIGLLLAFAVMFAGKQFVSQPSPFMVQPSVPSLMPPPLSCLCGTTKQSIRPFSVACPYCRNTLTVQPSATGDSIGATITGPILKSAAK